MAYRTSTFNFKTALPFIGAGIALIVLMPLLKTVHLAASGVSDGLNKAVTGTSNAALLRKYNTDQLHLDSCTNWADNIYSSFHSGAFEDEEKAAIYVNKCLTPFQVNLLCRIYHDKYGLSLRADFEQYVNWYDGGMFTNIKSLVKTNWF